MFDWRNRQKLRLSPTSVFLQHTTVTTTHIITRMTHGAPSTVVSEPPKDGIENVIIIGSGPAAHTAAIYAARYACHNFS